MYLLRCVTLHYGASSSSELRLGVVRHLGPACADDDADRDGHRRLLEPRGPRPGFGVCMVSVRRLGAGGGAPPVRIEGTYTLYVFGGGCRTPDATEGPRRACKKVEMM